MIYDQIQNVKLYSALSKRIEKAFDFLTNTNFAQMSDGKYLIDSDNTFAVISTYKTKQATDARPESHDKYIDIQFMIDGEEYVYCGFRNEMTERTEHRPEDDISFYQGQTMPYLLGKGRFLLIFPNDVHAPCACIDTPATVRKVVIKIIF